MKVGIFLLILVTILFSSCDIHIPTAVDIALDNTSKVTVGEGESCIGPLGEFACQEGLDCYKVSEVPHEVGYCFRIEDINDPEFDHTVWRARQKFIEDGVFNEEDFQ